MSHDDNGPQEKPEGTAIDHSEKPPYLHETVTRLLHRWSAGETQARDDLAVLVQREVRKLAQFQLSKEHGGFALQATSLVNAAYLRLLKRHRVTFRNRGHFFGTVSQEMRRVLVDNYRQRARQKRQGIHVPLEVADRTSDEREVDLVRLDDALQDLEGFRPEAARIVEMRFFCGLTYDQISDLLDLSPKQVRRQWEQARQWLHQELVEPSAGASSQLDD